MMAGPIVEEDAVTAAVCDIADEDMAGKDAWYGLILDVVWVCKGIGFGRCPDAVPCNEAFHAGVSTGGFTYAVLGFGVEAEAVGLTTGGGSVGVSATAEAEEIAAEAVDADPEA